MSRRTRRPPREVLTDALVHFAMVGRYAAGDVEDQLTLVRVLRFERSAIALARHPQTPLGELAQRCGYYDQAHLYRDWRDLAGCSPTAWAQQEELPSVHDAALNPTPR